MSDIYSFVLYAILTWLSNISLNLLYVLRRYVPAFRPLDYPVDLKATYRGQRLIGDSVTFPGLILCLAISAALYPYFGWSGWTFVPLLVFAGDMLGSFIKRRCHKQGGEFLPFVDHGNYMITSGFVLVLGGYLRWEYALLGILSTYILHPIACALAYRLKLRKYPY